MDGNSGLKKGENNMRYFFVLIAAVFLWSASSTSNAQVSISANFNLNTQPAWGPTGYDYVEYYYLPAIDVYYNVPQRLYYYNYRGHWVHSYNMPSHYRNYDLYHSYKVVLNERDPWKNDNNYRKKYSSYKDRHDQQVIRDSRDSKYFQNKYHPEHKNWLKQQKHDNGRDKGNKQDNNRGKHNNGKNKK